MNEITIIIPDWFLIIVAILLSLNVVISISTLVVAYLKYKISKLDIEIADGFGKIK